MAGSKRGEHVGLGLDRHAETGEARGLHILGGTCRLGGDGVLGAEACKEVLGMFFSDIFDTKTVNNQTECDGSCFMGEETWGALGLVVSRGLEVFDEAGVGKDAGLGQAIHAFSDFNNNVAIMDEWGKMVLFHNTFWNVFYWDTHIFRSFHGSA
eukprot:scaffold63644_cov46-Attheya_sp.AAC.4